MDKIFKTKIFIAVPGNPQQKIVGTAYYDTIKYQDKLWLVPGWLDTPSAGMSKPERLICLDGLTYEESPNDPRGDYVLNDPVPTFVLNGRIPPELVDMFGVILGPDILFPSRFGGN